MLNAPNLAPKDSELVRREIQEIRDPLEAFGAAVEAGEVTGFKDGGVYVVSPQGTFTVGYQYNLPRVIITDPCGNAHHGTRYSYGWVFDD
jgi:hypothetical protein